MRTKIILTIVCLITFFTGGFLYFRAEPIFGAPSVSYQRSLFPQDDLTYDLGTTTLRWRNIQAEMVSSTFYGDGSNLTGVSSPPGGTDGQVQYNNGGVFGGFGFWDNVNSWLGIGTSVPSTTLHVVGTSTFGGTVLIGSNLLPSANTSYDLGSSALAWNSIYAGSATFTTTTLSGFTNGSIVFATSSGVLSQDNANFFWDDSSNRFGVGTAVPSTTIHALSATEQLRLGYDANNYLQFTVNASGDTTVTSTGGELLIGSNLLPSANTSYDLGANGFAWKDVYVSSTLYAPGLTISNDGTKTTLLGSSGDYIRIGNAATAFSLSADDDLLVSGGFEVNGATRLEGNTTFAAPLFRMQDGRQLSFGSSDDAIFRWNNTYAEPDALQLNLDSTSKTWLINDIANKNTVYGHAAQADPTIFLHSNTTETDEWLSWAFVSITQAGTLTTGAGDIVLNPFSGSILPSADNTTTLGSSTKRFSELYVASSSIHIGTSTNEMTINYDTDTSSTVFSTNGTETFRIFENGTVFSNSFGPLTCPTGMISVPASPADGIQGFCVDKYEAKPVGALATSQAAGTPWVSLTQYTARAECIRAGKHLITESEWQAIAHNIEAVGWNWNGGVAGTNQMSDGHSDNSPSSALAADVTGDADDDPCVGTGQTCDTSTWSTQRRTYKLSNGEYIWDFGGNVWEWVDQTNYAEYPVYNSPSAGWQACSTSGDGVCGNTKTTNDQWYRGNTTALRGFIRGGYWVDGVISGAFELGLFNAPTGVNAGIGFRCSR